MPRKTRRANNNNWYFNAPKTNKTSSYTRKNANILRGNRKFENILARMKNVEKAKHALRLGYLEPEQIIPQFGRINNYLGKKYNTLKMYRAPKMTKNIRRTLGLHGNTNNTASKSTANSTKNPLNLLKMYRAPGALHL